VERGSAKAVCWYPGSRYDAEGGNWEAVAASTVALLVARDLAGIGEGDRGDGGLQLHCHLLENLADKLAIVGPVNARLTPPQYPCISAALS
jgi:hypothetical protein